MTTKKRPPIQDQPTKRRQTNKHTSHPGQPAASHASPKPKHGTDAPKAAASATAKSAAQQKEHPREQHPSTAARSQRRRRQSLGWRLTHLSGGSWFAILTGALVIGIIVFAIIASRGSPAAGSTSPQGLLATGTNAPAIAALPAADGKSYSLAQYKGQKVVVLEFFAPWCPHCQNETTALKQLQQDYGSKGVQVLSVSASPYGRNYEASGGTDTTPISMSDIQWFSSTFGLNYPALFDPSLKAGNAYGVTGFPTLYIVNKQGVITYATSGETSYATLQQQVNQALGQ
jgi:peroxiredoxin